VTEKYELKRKFSTWNEPFGQTAEVLNASSGKLL
jgi:hypothetical protein